MPDADRQVFQAVLALADDPDPAVRLQLALTLGETRGPQTVQALAGLARRYGGDQWMRAALLTLPPELAEALIQALVEAEGGLQQATGLLEPLAAVIGARRDDRQMAQLLTTIATAGANDAADWRRLCLQGLAAGLGRGKPAPLGSDTGRAALHQLLVAADPPVQQLALQIAALVELPKSDEMQQAYEAAAAVALDSLRPVDERRAALGVLTGAPFEQLAQVTKPLLDPRQPLPLQLAAVAALASSRDARVAAVLLEPYRSLTPSVQAAALETIFGHENRLPGLLDAIESGSFAPTTLDLAQRRQLSENRNPSLRERAAKLLPEGASQAERGEVIQRYLPALDGVRDPARGVQVFEKHCAKCHRLEGRGFQVGPDLSAAGTAADETLLADVLDPSRQITIGYKNYSVVTDDGRIFTGVLAAETATSITLRKEEGKEEVILRKDIDQIEGSNLSIMPEGLEKELPPRDAADLIGYLRGILGAAPPDVVTLFDDDPSSPAC